MLPFKENLSSTLTLKCQKNEYGQPSNMGKETEDAKEGGAENSVS